MDKQEIQKLPNNIGGDTKSFVAKLKKVLLSLSDSLSDVADRVDNVEPDEVAQLIGLKVTEEHTTDGNGMPQNNIVVEYDNTNVSDFASANIWLSDDNGSNFQRVGSSNNLRFIIENVKAGITYVVKATAVNKKGNESDFDEAPSAVITIKGSVLVPDPPTQFILTWDKDGPLWEWLYNDNGYVDFFELRLDANAGEYSDKLLDRTRNTFSRANPGVRSGMAYLFIRNIFGTYSQPATHQFSKPVGQKPNKPELLQFLYGVNIKMDPLPEGFTGYKLVINGNDVYTTPNNIFTYYQVSGKMTVKYCFIDDIGDGEYSDVSEIEIKTILDDIEIPTIDYDKFDDEIKETIDKANAQEEINTLLQEGISKVESGIEGLSADINEVDGKVEANVSKIEQTSESITSVVNNLNGSWEDNEFKAISGLGTAINQTSDSITTVVTELNKPPEECDYSAITQLKDDILLSVRKDGVINAINVSTEGIVIDGSKIHITGDTFIDGKVIIGANIADGAVGSKNLAEGAVDGNAIADGAVGSGSIADGAVTSGKLSAGSVGSVAIADGAVVADHIASNSITSAHITANAITSDKINAGAITADKIDADAVTADKIAAEAVTAEAIQAGSIIGQHISADAVTSRTIAAGAVQAENIQAGAITAEKIAANAITSDKIDAGAVTADKIAAGAITADKIDADAVTADKLNVDKLSSVTAVIGTLRTKTSGARMEIHDHYIVFWTANERPAMGIGMRSNGGAYLIATSGNSDVIVNSSTFPKEWLPAGWGTNANTLALEAENTKGTRIGDVVVDENGNENVVIAEK